MVVRGGAALPWSSRSRAHLAMLLGLLVVAILAGRLSAIAFDIAGTVLIAFFGFAAYRTPRLVLLLLVFLPMVDRYLVSALVPSSLEGISSFLAEGALGVATLAIGARGLRDGTLVPALSTPAFWLLTGFVAVGAVSALLNGVPPIVAAAGIVFTIDGAILFFLPRIVGFTLDQARVVVIAYVVVATATAILALLQVYLRPDIFGLQWSLGRFGEGARVGSFLDGNPNMLGAVLAMAAPFPILGLVRAKGNRTRLWLGADAFILVLALFYTFSRGAWLGLAVGVLVVALLVDRRALVAIVVFAALAFATAQVVPRGLLVAKGEFQQLELDLQNATVGRFGSIGAANDLRLLFIRNALPIVADHPLVGAGPGRYGGAVSTHFSSPLWTEYTAGRAPVVCTTVSGARICTGRTVDDFWLHILVEFGTLGALLLIGTLVAIGWELLARARSALGEERVLLAGFVIAGITLAVDSVTEMLLEGNTSSFVVWTMLGLGSALVMHDRARSGAAHRAAMAVRRHLPTP